MNRSEFFYDFLDGFFDLRFVGDVALNGNCFSAGRFDFFNAFCQFVFAAGKQRDSRAVFGKRFCGRQTQTAGRARDNRNFSI